MSELNGDVAHSVSHAGRPSVTASIDGAPSEGAVASGDRRTSSTSTGSSGNGLRKVFFAPSGAAGANEKISEEDEDGGAADESAGAGRGSGGPVTISQLKHSAGEKGPGQAHMREQAKQILALRKVQWDMIVVSARVASEEQEEGLA